MKKYTLVTTLLLLFAFTSNATAAFSTGFSCITNNDSSGDSCMTGETQFSLAASESGSNLLLTITNSGVLGGSITDVYIDDSAGVLGSIVTLIDADDGMNGDAAVDFSVGATPANLPSASSADPDFQATMGLAADSDSPMLPQNGINNNGESLGMLLSITAMDFDSVISAFTSGSLRVGLHGQSLGLNGEFSESFVSNVPLPAAAWLMIGGLISLGVFGRAKTS